MLLYLIFDGNSGKNRNNRVKIHFLLIEESCFAANVFMRVCLCEHNILTSIFF